MAVRCLAWFGWTCVNIVAANENGDADRRRSSSAQSAEGEVTPPLPFFKMFRYATRWVSEQLKYHFALMPIRTLF